MAVLDADLEKGLSKVGNFLLAHFHEALAEILSPMAAVVVIAVFCSLGEQLSPAGDRFNYVAFGGSLAVAALTIADLRSVISMGSQTIDSLCEYARVLLPTLTTAAVSAGAVTSAGAKYAVSALFSDILLRTAQNVLLPLICAFAACTTAGAALDSGQLQGVAGLLHWMVSTLLKALAGAFTLYLTVTGILSGSADEAAVKAARAVLSSALPVVGKTLSDASEAFVAGAALIRGAVGLFGLLAIMAAVALPVLRLGLRCLLFRFAAALSATVAGGQLARLIGGIGKAYALILGLVGTAAALTFLSIISLLRTVTG